MQLINRNLWNMLLVILFFNACSSQARLNDDVGTITKVKNWKMGVQLISFHGYSFVDAVNSADSSGVNYVEGYSFQKLGREFNDSTMSQLSLTGIKTMKQILDDSDLVMETLYVAAGRVKDSKGWKKHFDNASELGSTIIACQPLKNQWDMLDSLAGEYGIKIAIHQHARDDPYWHPDSVLTALEGHPNFGACADIGHWGRSGLDPVACLKKLKGYILDVHLKDIDSFNNLKANTVEMGAGVLDFSAIIKELKAQNYSGPINVEYEFNSDDMVATLINGLDYFNCLTQKVNKDISF